ncbi:MAG: RDD family protein [Candidatus Pelagadaptatus aseana]|uniref:RDD family protein n=1 Tax=Candidatus Pelagadaptatus aseana TaxID=3120508 RepID=UPI0039B2B986
MSQPTSHNTSPQETVAIAGLMRRLGAMVYDSLILMAVLMAYGSIALFVKYKIFQAPHIQGEKMELGLIGFVLMLVVIIGFYSFFWMRGGQTVGMKAWRLRLVNDQGLPVTLTQCITRCLFAWLSFALGGMGYLWCLVDRNGMAAHDHLSHTQVVVLPKPDKKKTKGQGSERG